MALFLKRRGAALQGALDLMYFHGSYGQSGVDHTPWQMMTFNVNGCSEWGRETWWNRQANLAKIVREFEPDLVGFQELPYWAAPAFFSQLPEWCPIRPEADIAAPVMFRRDRFRLVDAEVVKLPNTSQYAGQNRKAVWCRVRDIETGQDVELLNLHLAGGIRGSWPRQQAVRQIGERFSRAILLGDFNDIPQSAVHQYLTSHGWYDTFRGDSEAGTYLLAGRRTNRRLDWVLAPKGMPALSTIVEPASRSFSSDHLPVVASAT